MSRAATILATTILAATWLGLAQPAAAETLFKIVTVRDEIVVGLNDTELAAIGGKDAGALAKAIASKGSLTVWRYAVGRARDGSLQYAPLSKIGLLANASLRVEPYRPAHKVVPHE
jgi:hypothetical protein